MDRIPEMARWFMALMCACGVAAAPRLDYAYFVKRVQPVFARKRTGSGRCVDCHARESNSAAFRLQPLDANGAWTEEQSRKNFENAEKLVTPGAPLKSRLLTHPLAAEAGGDEFHTGGKFWKSRKDPEWQTLARWVRGAKLP
jgi:hypothetical protein